MKRNDSSPGERWTKRIRGVTQWMGRVAEAIGGRTALEVEVLHTLAEWCDGEGGVEIGQLAIGRTTLPQVGDVLQATLAWGKDPDDQRWSVRLEAWIDRGEASLVRREASWQGCAWSELPAAVRERAIRSGAQSGSELLVGDPEVH